MSTEGELNKLIKDHPHMMDVLVGLSRGEKRIHKDHPTQVGWPKPNWLAPNNLRILKNRAIIREWTQRRSSPHNTVQFFALIDAQSLERWIERQNEKEEVIDWAEPIRFNMKELFADYIIASGSDRWEILEEIAESVEYAGERGHILLVGPPASGKTIIMQCIMALDIASFCSGGVTSAPGFAELCALEPKRIRLVDEVDKWMRKKAMREAAEGIFLPLMEEGLVAVHKGRKHFTIAEKSLIIVGCNSIEGFSREFISRFKAKIFEFPEYTKSEFIEIIRIQLSRDPWKFDIDLAEFIGTAVWKLDKNPRTATGLASAAKIARLKGRDPKVRIQSATDRMRKFNPTINSMESIGVME